MTSSKTDPNQFLIKINTPLQWEDLVLQEHLIMNLNEIKNYIIHNDISFKDYQMERKIKPGYRVLFTGPSGTGKTLATCLLGKSCNKDVYKIDLAQVVSKHIGETEKNLSQVFDEAESKDCILFFNEADTLFGKRINVRDARDRYANREISYLLDRIENYDGLVIFTTKYKNSIDEAFIRHFQLVCDFKLPDTHLRYVLWQKALPDEFEFESDIDLKYFARNYVLSPSSIINVLKNCSLLCQKRDERVIRLMDIQAGLKREMNNEDNLLS